MKTETGEQMKKKNNKKVIWYKPSTWHFRNNTARKTKEVKLHPSLVVGETETDFVNVGLTTKEKRGHHKNIKLSRNPDPKNKKDAYIRDDIEEHNKNALKQKLNHFRKLPKEDVEKVQKVINKKRNNQRGGSH